MLGIIDEKGVYILKTDVTESNIRKAFEEAKAAGAKGFVAMGSPAGGSKRYDGNARPLESGFNYQLITPEMLTTANALTQPNMQTMKNEPSHFPLGAQPDMVPRVELERAQQDITRIQSEMERMKAESENKENATIDDLRYRVEQANLVIEIAAIFCPEIDRLAKTIMGEPKNVAK